MSSVGGSSEASFFFATLFSCKIKREQFTVSHPQQIHSTAKNTFVTGRRLNCYFSFDFRLDFSTANVPLCMYSVVCVSCNFCVMFLISLAIITVYCVYELDNKWIDEYEHESRGLGRRGQGVGLLPPSPIKFEAEVRNCIWRLCRTGVKVMTLTSPLCCINDQHDFKGSG